MAYAAELAGGQHFFSSAEFVEEQVRAFEDKWERRWQVSLSAQIMIVQLIDSLWSDFTWDRDADDDGLSIDAVTFQITTLFPSFLEGMRDQIDRLGPDRPRGNAISPIQILKYLPGWLAQDCDIHLTPKFGSAPSAALKRPD